MRNKIVKTVMLGMTLSVFLTGCSSTADSGSSSAAASSAAASSVSSASSASENVMAESQIEYLSTSEHYSSASEVDLSETEKKLQGVVAGVDDRYILQGNESVDLLAGIYYDPSIIIQVMPDTPDFNPTQEGDYKVTYTFVVQSAQLAIYQQKAGLDVTVSDSDPDIQYLAIEKQIHVVSEADAAGLADQGIQVWKSADSCVADSKGQDVAGPELSVPSCDITGSTAVDANGNTLS